MKKMPCLFQRDFSEKQKPVLLEAVTPGCEWVLEGKGEASIKWDGTSCLVRDGQLFARYDYKKRVRDKGRQPPETWEPCQPEPDPTTGHWPGWVLVTDQPQYKWHRLVWERWVGKHESNGLTFELCGPHISANPHFFAIDGLCQHGANVVAAPRTFDGLKTFLEAFRYEGVVFRHGDLFAKIRRADYGFAWPIPFPALT